MAAANYPNDRGSDPSMERISFRIEEDDLNEVEALVEEGEYPNRSEAIRDGVRRLLDEKD